MILAALLTLAPLHSGYFCNFAKIVAPNPRRKVAVRIAPSNKGRARTVLDAGTTVYTCDETRDWVQIRFPSVGHPCPGTEVGLRLELVDTCSDGWVRQTQVEAISG